jgi:hypothetical protein
VYKRRKRKRGRNIRKVRDAAPWITTINFDVIFPVPRAARGEKVEFHEGCELTKTEGVVSAVKRGSVLRQRSTGYGCHIISVFIFLRFEN